MRMERTRIRICQSMYYRDEDGFGMTDDEEINLYGAIDRKGKVVKII